MARRRSSAGFRRRLVDRVWPLSSARRRGRVLEEERAIAHFKHKGPTELWSFMPSDGQPLNLRVAPHLDAAHTGHVLAPGDRFEVAEKSFHDEVTYLRLRDGRGWAFDGKPVLRSGWWPFASGSEKMVLCVPVHQQVHQGLMHSGVGCSFREWRRSYNDSEWLHGNHSQS
eukprot:g832.t1